MVSELICGSVCSSPLLGKQVVSELRLWGGFAQEPQVDGVRATGGCSEEIFGIAPQAQTGVRSSDAPQFGRSARRRALRRQCAPQGGRTADRANRRDSAHRRVGAPQTARTADRAHRRVCAPQIGRTAGLGAPQTECAAGRTLRRQNVPQGGRSADSTGRSAVVIRRQTGAPQADGRSAD